MLDLREHHQAIEAHFVGFSATLLPKLVSFCPKLGRLVVGVGLKLGNVAFSTPFAEQMKRA